MSGESSVHGLYESGSNSCLEPTLAAGLLKKLFGCQANEKVFPPLNEVSLRPITTNGSRLFRVLFRLFAKMVRETPVLTQPYFTTVTGINSFVEPNFLVYEVHYPLLDRALATFRAELPFSAEEESVVHRCREGRISRIQLCEEQVRETVGMHVSLGRLALIRRQTSLVLEIAQAKSTHWRYAIFATRCLRTLVRKDAPISAPHMKYFLEKCYDNHPSLVRITYFLLSSLERTNSTETA
jgi:proteasome activator subunit 4